jgi:motility quorum-sensing regulator/GCU-specific mRNA interferase toxin
MNDKRKPSHDLAAFKRAASSGEGFFVTRVALLGAADLGFDGDDIRRLIGTMQVRHFYKSTTSNFDHRQWQDVYHVPSPAGVVYVKFTDGKLAAFHLLSFKAKE